MQVKTILSVATLAVSSAALAQMTTQPNRPPPGNNMSMPMNSTMPDSTMPNSAMPDSNTPMNTEDETMMNDSSTPNSTMAPK